MPLLSQDVFVLRFDDTNPGVTECHCSVCQRLVAASREIRVLEIVQRIHLSRWHPETLVQHKFTM